MSNQKAIDILEELCTDEDVPTWAVRKIQKAIDLIDIDQKV